MGFCGVQTGPTRLALTTLLQRVFQNAPDSLGAGNLSAMIRDPCIYIRERIWLEADLDRGALSCRWSSARAFFWLHINLKHDYMVP